MKNTVRELYTLNRKKYIKCDKCKKISLLKHVIAITDFLFCINCWPKEVALAQLKNAEANGLFFKYKKDRNQYLKNLEQEQKINQEKYLFKINSKSCFICKKKFLPKNMKSLSKNVWLCISCFKEKPDTDLIQKVKIQKEIDFLEFELSFYKNDKNSTYDYIAKDKRQEFKQSQIQQQKNIKNKINDLKSKLIELKK